MKFLKENKIVSSFYIGLFLFVIFIPWNGEPLHVQGLYDYQIIQKYGYWAWFIRWDHISLVVLALIFMSCLIVGAKITSKGKKQ